MVEESSLIRNNFLLLEVVMSHTQSVTQFTDAPAVTLENFIGSLGGILNLWVGLSFVTIIELLELLTKVVKELLQNHTSKHNTKTNHYSQ